MSPQPLHSKTKGTCSSHTLLRPEGPPPTSRKTPTTARPSGAAAASPKVLYFLAFQWTRCSWRGKKKLSKARQDRVPPKAARGMKSVSPCSLWKRQGCKPPCLGILGSPGRTTGCIQSTLSPQVLPKTPGCVQECGQHADGKRVSPKGPACISTGSPEPLPWASLSHTLSHIPSFPRQQRDAARKTSPRWGRTCRPQCVLSPHHASCPSGSGAA